MPLTTYDMEEHFEAYFHWKRLGISNAWCWHIDAHLDIGKTGLTDSVLEKLQDCQTSTRAASLGLMGNSYLPWGGLHCGNYLYPAIQEGIVGRLTWVIPPELPSGNLLDWAREHLENWFDLTLAEFQSLRLLDGKVCGEILGIPFEMGSIESLDLPDTPVLLDIDIDYFLNDFGEKWGQAETLATQLSKLESQCTTVAYSVIGGFTPDQERDLASPWITPITAQHQTNQLDCLAKLVRCRQYQEALTLEIEQGIEALYLQGTAQQNLKNYEQAYEIWQRLLAHDGIPPDGIAYLHGLSSQVSQRSGKLDVALKHAKSAMKLEPNNYRHVLAEAVALEESGRAREAVKRLRKTLRMSGDYVFGLMVRFALATVYEKQGKTGLAKMEMQKLAKLDTTGQFKARTLLKT